jgi:TolB-like protein
MTTGKDNVPERDEPHATAARWFVELDAGPLDAAKERELKAWLERDPEHEAELARCEAAMELARELQGDDELRWAFADATRLAETPPARFRLSWYRRPVLAWSVAAIAVVVAVVAVGVSWQREPAPLVAPPAASARDTLSQELVRELAVAKPVVLSPDTANLVVDARSVAVLPFELEPLAPGGDSAAAENIVATLYNDIVRDLAAIPGVHVFERSALASYAQSYIAPEEIALQLSVRGVVAARVTSADGRVRVVLTIVDAAQSALGSEQTFDRPVAELTALRTDIVTTIATTLAAPVGVPEPGRINEE